MNLGDYEKRWRQKPILEKVYNDFFQRVQESRIPGLTVEIGGGLGKYGDYAGDVLVSDIQATSGLDVCFDALCFPFSDSTFSNIVGVDVLHHFQFPARFFKEASRALRHGGRLIFVEPAITVGSFTFYRWFHHEPVRFIPLEGLFEECSTSDPYDSNQAIPTILASTAGNQWLEQFGLRVAMIQYFGIFVYPLSGGFKKWSLIPKILFKPCLAIDQWLSKYLGKYLGFRMLLVLEKV